MATQHEPARAGAAGFGRMVRAGRDGVAVVVELAGRADAQPGEPAEQLAPLGGQLGPALGGAARGVALTLPA